MDLHTDSITAKMKAAPIWLRVAFLGLCVAVSVADEAPAKGTVGYKTQVLRDGAGNGTELLDPGGQTEKDTVEEQEKNNGKPMSDYHFVSKIAFQSHV